MDTRVAAALSIHLLPPIDGSKVQVGDMNEALSAVPPSRMDRLSFSSNSPHAYSPHGGSSADYRRRSSSRRTDASSSSFSRPIFTSRPVSLWTHEPPNFSTHELVLNPDLIAAVGGISEGSELFEVRIADPDGPLGPVRGRDDMEAGPSSMGTREAKEMGSKHNHSGMMRKGFLFKASQAVGDLACIERAGSQLQLSISRSIASIFGLYNRCEVVLSKVPRSEHTVSHVELYFRDQYVGRADMWRLSSLLEDSCVYVGQKVTLANCVRATVGRIFIDEKKVMSGYIGPQTRSVFRSESAKFNLFIQMATEMWDFDEDGELYYEKALSGFLPELDRRWRKVPANHVVSVILFARVYYDESELHMLQEYELPLRQEESGKKRWYIDYYKVLVDLESDCDWPSVLTLLKEEFFRFSHDVLLLRRPVAGPAGAPWLEEQHADLLRRDRALLAGTLSSSHEGNILEAVNLALNPFDEHYIDRDLNRTGLDLLVITAGTGHFDVNKQLLRLTTERLIDNGIGLDLVCLTKMPLHSVPLFHFQSQVPLPESFAGATAPTAGTGLGPGSTKKRRGTTNSVRGSSDQSAPPDPLYFDPKHASAGALSSSQGNQKKSSGLVDFYGIPHWVDCSFYNMQQDKPFRANRFIPRCKMHEVQMLGLMENEISDISIPYIDFARVPGILASGGQKAFSNTSSNTPYGSGNTKQSRSFVLTTESFGDLNSLGPKEQRRVMREQYDKETFRDLGDVPSTYRSWVVQGPGERSTANLSSSPPIIRTSSYASTVSKHTTSSDQANQRPEGQQASRASQNTATSRSPAKTMRGGRTTLMTSPRLESHDEHPNASDGMPQDQSPEENRLSFLSNTDSMASLASTKTGGFLTPSRAGSIRSLSTINRGLRPLEPMGKARALVAPSQVSFDSLHERADLGSKTSGDSPAKAKASSMLLGERKSVTPVKPKKGYANWLWASFKGVGKDTSDVTTEAGSKEVESGAASSSEASRKIQVLLKRSSSQTSPSASSSSISTPTKEKNGRFEGDDLTPSPISIPSQITTSTTMHGRSKGPSNDFHTLQNEQEMHEQALEDEEIKARYAQQAQVEKQTLVNPSNPRESLKGTAQNSQIIRWQHLFPRRLNQHVVKWRSMTTPACLPLTTIYVPSEADLKKQWQEYPYQISISADTASFLVKRASSTHPALAVLREMTSQRLAQGFQFIVPTVRMKADGSTTANTTTPKHFRLREPWELFQPGNLASGNPIFLSMTNQIHRISYDRSSNCINVKRYVRRTDYDTSAIDYACCIWSRNLPGYQTVHSKFQYPDFGAYNWTYLDALIAGYNDDEEFGSATKYWRTRFVVVPSEGSPPTMTGSSGERLSDEEVRLMGMDRLADLFGRARWRPKNSSTNKRGVGAHRPSASQIPAAPLRFIPTSLDPAMSLRDEEFMRRVEAAHQEDNNEAGLRKPKRERSSSNSRCVKDLDKVEVVRAMYSATNGLKINDRLWNRIMYRESFSGADLVSWLCREFDDIKSREDATDWGNQMLNEQLLEHVHRYHGFLDGHYFYRLTPEYLARKPTQQEKGWFASSAKAKNGSNNSGSELRSSSTSREGTEADMPAHKGSRKMLMSRSMIIDVDSSRKSDRAEVALLHYDTAHNPANGFNFQIHWLGTTARFIEDTVQSWTRSVERYGLRCIEAPINQIKDVSQHNPFQAPLPIPLALHPPASAVFASHLPAHTSTNHFFQYSLLRKFGFILDQEASEKYRNINKEVDIEYKSRPSVFDLSQFVHRNGVAFVQVLKGNEGFLWLDNRLFNSHLHQQQQQHTQPHHQQQSSAGPSRDADSSQTWLPSADSVRKEFVEFCSDVTRLEAFYRDTLDGLQSTRDELKGQQAPL